MRTLPSPSPSPSPSANANANALASTGEQLSMEEQRDNVVLTEVKSIQQIVHERVAAADVIELDKDEKDADSDIKFIGIMTAEEIAQDNIEAAKVAEPTTDIDKYNKVEQKEDNDGKGGKSFDTLKDLDKECVSDRLTQLYKLTAAGTYRCNDCRKAAEVNDDLIQCAQCQRRFHESCLKERYHMALEDIVGTFVCPVCKNIPSEKCDSDGDTSEYCDD